ncbi:siderophore ABC transporter substrate-binding protein [Microbacterium sp. A94]|uniref:siderophore ABC transporter substrate-binding protein n=1 Tax=Microbacterium sp. A94 TaxID=3450717 RepID=UPI003F42E185
MSSRRPLAAASLVLVSALTLAACAASPAAEAEAPSSADEPTTVTVEDNNGEHTIDLPLASIVATDNRTFETLESWGVELTAAAVSLMPNTNSYTEDETIIDLGSHREPNLEAVVAVEPDLIINGQRFAQFHDDFVSYAPDAVVLELDPREGEPFEEELKRQTTILGEVFGKQAEAKALNDALDAAIERVAAAYDDAETVMAVTTSGGEIGYIAPHVGRTLGPVFDFAGLTPALEVAEATDDHQGDDIAVEAIADSNPDWILVMDRDAAVGADDPNFSPAADVLENSEALAKVTAVVEGNIIYMPADTYTNEGIQTYTEFLESFADALEGN